MATDTSGGSLVGVSVGCNPGRLQGQGRAEGGKQPEPGDPRPVPLQVAWPQPSIQGFPRPRGGDARGSHRPSGGGQGPRPLLSGPSAPSAQPELTLRTLPSAYPFGRLPPGRTRPPQADPRGRTGWFPVGEAVLAPWHVLNFEIREDVTDKHSRGHPADSVALKSVFH